MDLSWRNMKKIMLIVAFGIILYMLLQNIVGVTMWIQNFMDIISPFILGACIAFVINIPMKFFEKIMQRRRKKSKTVRVMKYQKMAEKVTDKVPGKGEISKTKRFLAALCSFFIILAVLVLLIWLVVPEFVNVIKSLVQYLTGLPNELKPIIDELIANYPEFGEELSKLQLDFSNILNSSITFIKDASAGIMDWVGKTISYTISGIANFVIGIIFAFYILMSKEKVGRNLKRMVIAFLPDKVAQKFLEVTKLSKEAFTNFITGQLKEAIILGILCYIGMLILQLPYSLTISLLTTVTALIPIFGAFIGATVGVILLLAISPVKAAIFLVFIIVLQQIETNLIYPKVVGDSVGVPGIIVLVAITVGGSLGGALGMLISLPIASVIYTLVRASVEKRLKEKNITDIS